MKCNSCYKKAHHIKVIDGIEICENCGGFSVAGGTGTDGLLTRNRFSVRRDSVMNEVDTLPPHVYDKHDRKVKPREDFIKRYPGRVNDTYNQKELDDAGMNKLKVCKPKPKVDSEEIDVN
jgi:hypothetical protein